MEKTADTGSPSPDALRKIAAEATVMGSYGFLVDCDACRAKVPMWDESPGWHASAEGWSESPQPCATHVTSKTLPALASAYLAATRSIAELQAELDRLRAQVSLGAQIAATKPLSDLQVALMARQHADAIGLRTRLDAAARQALAEGEGTKHGPV